MIAKVSVDLNIKKSELFDYVIPVQFLGKIVIGSYVKVSFNKKLIFGYVVEILDEEGFKDALPIIDVYGDLFSITKEDILLAKAIKQIYDTTFYKIFQLMKSINLKIKSKEYFYPFSLIDMPSAIKQKKVLITGKDVSFIELCKRLESENKGYISIEEAFYGSHLYDKRYFVKNDSKQKTNLRDELLRIIKNNPGILESVLIEKYFFSKNLIKTLVDLGAIEEELFLRPRVNSINYSSFDKINYSQLENEALSFYEAKIDECFAFEYQTESVFLKFLLKLCINALNKKESVLITVPTIIRGEKLFKFLKTYLNDNVGIMHSLTKKSDEYLFYQQLKTKAPSVLITTPNNALVTLFNLKHIIIDTEESNFYKTMNYPYFDIKEILLLKAKINKLKVILSSSVLSLNTYKARIDKKIISLFNYERKENFSLIDMRTEVFSSKNKLISEAVIKFIMSALSNHERCALIVNNLSFGKNARCKNCGEALKCPICGQNICAKLKQDTLKFLCPECGYKFETVPKCSVCLGEVKTYGLGLENAYSLLSEIFYDQKIIKVSHEELGSEAKLTSFLSDSEENRECLFLSTPIILTELAELKITKVVFLAFDDFLLMPKFVNLENSFLFLKKALLQAEVIVQSFQITNSFFNEVKYNNFYEKELSRRKEKELPPFCVYSQLLVHAPNESKFSFANYVKVALSKLDVKLYGPVYNDKTRDVELNIKTKDAEAVFSVVKRCETYFKSSKVNYTFLRRSDV